MKYLCFFLTLKLIFSQPAFTTPTQKNVFEVNSPFSKTYFTISGSEIYHQVDCSTDKWTSDDHLSFKIHTDTGFNASSLNYTGYGHFYFYNFGVNEAHFQISINQ